MADGHSITYRELERGASLVSRRLAARGIIPGDRVATTLPPGVAFVELLHALPRLGAALVPINTRLGAAERAWQLRDCGARLVVDEPLEGTEAEVARRPEIDPGATQTAIYTSGTTATPKRVELTYANHAASAFASAWNIGVAPDDRWLCVLPLFHVGGLAILLRSAIYGTTALLHDGFDAAAVAESLSGGEATVASLVPTMLRRLRAAGLESAPALRAALVGGGPVPRDLLEWGAGRGLPLLQTYGMTETASQIATLGAGEALDKLGSAGRMLPGASVAISGEGEILVRGPMVSRAALAGDGWLHTGDLGRLDADGFLYVEGRRGDTIVSGGENVAAAEVEEALLAHPGVEDAAVAGRPDPEWGEVVTAFVVAPGVSDAELTRHCRARIAGYKLPRRIVRVPSIPRTASGKVLKGRL
ncbi:MAG: o-succinylbenzoate--CoA ligase [Thermoleophilaceae bacterium]